MKALKSVFAVAAPLYDFCFLSGATGDLERPRLSLSDDDLAAIKAAATPSTPGSWVSTQEALAAYLVHTVGRALCRQSCEDVHRPSNTSGGFGRIGALVTADCWC